MFSNGDCTQNWFFTASAFEASFKNSHAHHRAIDTVSILSDNCLELLTTGRSDCQAKVLCAQMSCRVASSAGNRLAKI